MSAKRAIVTVDGPAGAGKSTVSMAVARALGLQYLDTGAMYRAVGLLVAARPDPEATMTDPAALAEAAARELQTGWEPEGSGFSIRLGERDVTGEIRTATAASWASRIAALPPVRAALTARMRAWAGSGGWIVEGRDIGTVVFPEAEFKFFLDASPAERSRRRGLEEGRDPGEVARDLETRDRRDSSREVAPLRPADDALFIDTTGWSIDEVVGRVLARIARGAS